MGSRENFTSKQAKLMKLGLLLDDNMYIMHIALNMFYDENCGCYGDINDEIMAKNGIL